MQSIVNRFAIVGTMAVCASVTVAAVAVPWVAFAYREPGLHIALEVAAALVALLATFLVAGRYVRSHQLNDLLLTTALGMLATSNLGFSALPLAVMNGRPAETWLWLSMSGQLLGATALALATFAPALVLRQPRRWTLDVGAASVVFVLLVAGVASHYAPDVLPVRPPHAGEPPTIGHPAVAVIQLTTMCAFAAAAIGLIRRQDDGDSMLTWFAAGAVAATFARLDFFLYPSLYTEWLYVSDLLRLLSYLLLLTGAAYEITSYWRRMSDAAVLEERRRIARDLHDGLAQELAYISRLARGSSTRADLNAIQASANRALDESRRAIAALTRPLDEPLHVVLSQAVEEVASRSSTQTMLDFALDERLELDRDRRDAILRVSCEAVSNATRHGRASRVRVELHENGGTELLVSDDGIGFDPHAFADGQSRGFGISSMRERVEALGGSFHIASARGRGTRIRVIIH